jgi:hypothetical protein
MGIKVEFNPDLALRKFGTLNRLEEECLPKELETGKHYPFLKQGQRNYWLDGELPLLETKGNEQLSRPLASIIILEATHFKIEDKVYTKGFYLVTEVYDINNPEIYFEGINKIRSI